MADTLHHCHVMRDEQKGEVEALLQVEQQGGNADGGMTTSNTPPKS
jgi:hypothetical protein